MAGEHSSVCGMIRRDTAGMYVSPILTPHSHQRVQSSQHISLCVLALQIQVLVKEQTEETVLAYLPDNVLAWRWCLMLVLETW